MAANNGSQGTHAPAFPQELQPSEEPREEPSEAPSEEPSEEGEEEEPEQETRHEGIVGVSDLQQRATVYNSIYCLGRVAHTQGTQSTQGTPSSDLT